ncbi:hypothetical protein [Amycolatopsis eburnea]|uniref:Uncharacterized protein n=1 Tax=Amycolatopsis eburnea TaxID=2267691 RepID=A0A3R9E1K5_9PSEU|nr:hypothetical protein [Amycolatopsis eburnea]RSD20048.1 hypothetical protein EIY87_17680 [Amycolatopsis eburnea]
MNESVVVSRTEGRHWILAGVLLLVAGGFVWLALASTQRSPGVAGWVFGGAFGLLGLNLVRRSVRQPARNELIIDAAGVSRVIGGVVWALRWDELAAASVVGNGRKHERHQVVLSPARDDFASPHHSLVRIGGGDFQVAGIGLSEREVPRVREALAKHVGVQAERVAGARVPAPPPVAAAAPEWMPPLQPSGSVKIHVNGWDRAAHWWLRFFALAIELGLGVAIEFGPRNGLRTAGVVVFIAVFVGMTWREIGWQQSRSRRFRITLELSAAGLHWKTYYRQIVVSWPEIAELRTPTRLLEFRPAGDDFPLRRPELDELRQTDGWYRLPARLSATAAKELDTRIREVLPHRMGGLSSPPNSTR